VDLRQNEKGKIVLCETQEDPPRIITYCSNEVSRAVFCLRKIYDDDIEFVEIAPKRFLCGQCVERILNPPDPIMLYDSKGRPMEGKRKATMKSSPGWMSRRL